MNGTNGIDGVGYDDLKIEYDGLRTVTLVYAKGAKVVRTPITFAGMLFDQGVYTDAFVYERGDVVTAGGSSWVAVQDAPPGKPNDGSTPEKSGWRLQVKRGSEGKRGDRGEKGEAGRNGRDLTQMDNRGAKW
jgi:integrin beta 3